jgi:hypothetical protein
MPNFRANCSDCCGLCCVVPNLLAVQGFRVDKATETPCVHLSPRHRCSIHATREIHGYAACEGFDCFGAGQWITQRLFGGASWTDSPVLARQMFHAYRHWAPRFEAAALLEAALPYVRDDARGPVIARIKTLTVATEDFGPSDGRQLRRETIEMIRGMLRADAKVENAGDRALPL